MGGRNSKLDRKSQIWVEIGRWALEDGTSSRGSRSGISSGAESGGGLSKIQKGPSAEAPSPQKDTNSSSSVKKPPSANSGPGIELSDMSGKPKDTHTAPKPGFGGLERNETQRASVQRPPSPLPQGDRNSPSSGNNPPSSYPASVPGSGGAGSHGGDEVLSVILTANDIPTIKKIVEGVTAKFERFRENVFTLREFSFVQKDLNVEARKLEWAELCLEEFDSLRNARYRLVPSKIAEDPFWHFYFTIIKREMKENFTKVENPQAAQTIGRSA